MIALLVALAAALLFLSEPAAGKTILPWLGGTPAAWGTALVFFQVALIAGYAIVDQSLRRGGPRALALAHVGLLLTAALVMMVHVPFGTARTPAVPTFLRTFGLLALEIGIPTVALCLTSPALQARNAALRGDRGVAGYALYAASNTGSLLGLLLFPFLLEPLLDLSTHWNLWRGLYWVIALGIAAAWLVSWKRLPPAIRQSTQAAMPERRVILLWLARSAIPAALLAAVTAYLTRDLAPIPLLWIIPLGLYLVTWIVAFSRPNSGLIRFCERYQDVFAVVAALIFLSQPGVLVGGFISLGVMVLVGLVQHSALARSAPSEVYLGRFYVWLACGGAAGTFLVVVVAPVLFPVPIEAPLALALAVALGVPVQQQWSRRGTILFLSVGLIAATVPWLAQVGKAALASLCIGAGILAMLWRWAPKRAGLALAGLAVGALVVELASPEYHGSSHGLLGRFVVKRNASRVGLISGSTLHGLELFPKPGERPSPTLYYARQGPYGDLVRLMKSRGDGWRFGVVGLGIGSLSCTAEPGTRFVYFEINAGVVRLARDTTRFRSLQVCSPDAEIRLGDGRLELAKEPGRFDLLTIDAFNSDAIPTHLLTREAFELYRQRLDRGGVVAFHVSNRFLDLAPVAAGLAHDAGWVAVQTIPDVPLDKAIDDGAVWSTMVTAAADSGQLDALVASGRWMWAPRPSRPVWTDSRTPLARALQLSRGALLGK